MTRLWQDQCQMLFPPEPATSDVIKCSQNITFAIFHCILWVLQKSSFELKKKQQQKKQQKQHSQISICYCQPTVVWLLFHINVSLVFFVCFDYPLLDFALTHVTENGTTVHLIVRSHRTRPVGDGCRRLQIKALMMLVDVVNTQFYMPPTKMHR